MKPRTAEKIAARPTIYDAWFSKPDRFDVLPLAECIKTLDKHCCGQESEIWLAWCNVRTAVMQAGIQGLVSL